MAQLAYNKKAGFNYELLDKYEAGIELFGFEVKSLRTGRGASLDGSHVLIRGGEAFLVGAHIPPFQAENTAQGYDSRRVRRLLLTRAELDVLAKAADTKGLTLVPIAMYNKRRHIKLELALARGKKKFDKRETIKKRDTDRDVARELRGRIVR